MASNNNSKKNRNKTPNMEEEPYDPQLAKGGRKEKRRSKRHNDKLVLKQYPEYADEYFDNFEKRG
jgi:hypothetical protein